ncbi:hypothetical protein [Legionella hackeliae]|uniref:Peptidase C58 YopT-type domain-containing protein n=1 Tax=Legionella hackeliae TaxID=449 RepID=A0A0A8UWM5_LEGHA|nr:hypothetical protein [Legionella hackeliae]KTD12537.1 hypothetical protein Lhac_1408 [Legionella hackeliae]CEK11951.1 protein of unknown function [Legionella hackeliae]STX48725.1 Uncharacterised protein [Legionella hackeliae]
MADFQYVEKHNGQYIPFPKKQIRATHDKKFPYEAYTGACAGTVASVLERLIFQASPSLHFFKRSPSVLLPSPEKCIINQCFYEQDPEYFFTRLVRDKLHISQTGYPQSEEYRHDINDIANTLTNDGDKNEIILLNVILSVDAKKAGPATQDHMMALIKHDGQYIFCDPDAGIAIFNKSDALKAWLKDETVEGALKYCSNYVETKMLISSRKNDENAMVTNVKRKVQTIHMQCYTYDSIVSSRIQANL